MISTFLFLIRLFIKLIIQSLNYYIQNANESLEIKKISYNLKDHFALLENSLILKEYNNLAEIYNKYSIRSINIELFKKDKKTNALILDSKKIITENVLAENIKDLNFITKNITKFLEKSSAKFYLQKTQEKFLAATTKEAECNFKKLLSSNQNDIISYIYNPFFTIEVCSSNVKMIVNYTYSSALLLVTFNFNKTFK